MKADSNGKIERVVWMILDMIGEDPDPEGLLDRFNCPSGSHVPGFSGGYFGPFPHFIM